VPTTVPELEDEPSPQVIVAVYTDDELLAFASANAATGRFDSGTLGVSLTLVTKSPGGAGATITVAVAVWEPPVELDTVTDTLKTPSVA
jgi:hypothetical protein